MVDGGVELGVAETVDLSGISKTTNIVIHQKNKLSSKYPQKLWPLRLAI